MKLPTSLPPTLLILVFILGVFSRSHAAPGDVDLSFDAGSAGWSDSVKAIAVQPDGKVIVAGGGITRVNADGSRDSSFVVEQDPNMGIGYVTAIALQADGKLLVCHVGGIDRLNPDGSQDTSFTTPIVTVYGGTPSGPRAVAVSPDGKIFIGGDFRVINGEIRSSMARLNADGSLDASFVPGTSDQAFATVLSIVLQPDGKAMIAGYRITARRDSVARVNPDGSIDEATFFSVKTDDFVESVALQADGKLIVADYSGAIIRLNQNGSLDPAFSAGAGADRGVFAMALQADGKVLIGGAFAKVSGIDRDRIARLNADGTLDTAFDAGPGPHPSIFAIALLPNAMTLIGGRDLAGTGDIDPFDHLIRLHTDGSRDGTFTTEGTGIGGSVYSLLPQPDGKVLISGGFRSINRTRLRGNNARLNADGSFDSAFDPGGPAGNIVLQPDGKTIIGGSGPYFSGQNSIVRFNADGSVDTGFSLGSGADFPIHAVASLADGRLLVGGQFERINGTPCNGIARLNNDGSVDATFTAEIFQFSHSIYSIVVQPDGKALIGGEFSSADNTQRYGIARLNANGSLDSSFNHVAVSNNSPIDVRTIALQQDGKVIIGGYFQYVHGTRRDGIARLNANGTLDTTFNPGTDFFAGPITLQADGKALVGVGGIVRLNLDGSLDDTFQAPVTGNVVSIAVQSDGNILIGGGFNTVNGVSRPGVARLFGDSGLPPNIPPTVSISNPANGATYAGPATVEIDVQASDSDGTIARVDFYADQTLLASDDTAPFEISWENVPAGSYSLRAVATDDRGATSTSGVVNIVVTNSVPLVSISSPVSGSTYDAPAIIEIDAEASDSDGSVARVDFFAGDTLLVADSSAPFAISWENVPAGNYSLTARATDNLGASTTSPPVNIIVTAPPAPPLAPTGLKARAVSRAKIKLQWLDNATDETSYKIERSVNGRPFQQIAQLGADITHFTDRGLTAGKKYFYRVRASSAAGDSLYSNSAKAKAHP